MCLKINPNKTKTVRISNKRKENLTLKGRTINEMETFLYLGSVVTEEGVPEQDIKICISKVHSSFIQLFTEWNSYPYEP